MPLDLCAFEPLCLCAFAFPFTFILFDVAPLNRTIEKLVISVYNEKEGVDNEEITFFRGKDRQDTQRCSSWPQGC